MTPSRQLAAQAKNIFDTDLSNQALAVLLATESMKLEPNTDAAQILLKNTLARPIAIIPVDGDVHFDFGQTGSFTVSGTYQGASREWEIVPGYETYYSVTKTQRGATWRNSTLRTSTSR